MFLIFYKASNGQPFITAMGLSLATFFDIPDPCTTFTTSVMSL
jgi:hypothetical protein